MTDYNVIGVKQVDVTFDINKKASRAFSEEINHDRLQKIRVFCVYKSPFDTPLDHLFDENNTDGKKKMIETITEYKDALKKSLPDLEDSEINYLAYPQLIYMLCAWRSEEHTSELQSHSFISYAVFCLKKKKTKYNHDNSL